MRHGKGKFVWADGCIYHGDFINNNMEGKGIGIVSLKSRNNLINRNIFMARWKKI